MTEQSNLIYVKTKQYAMELLKKYDLLNVIPSNRQLGRLLYVFERTDELVADLDRLSREYHAKKGKAYYFSNTEVKTLMGLLEGYAIGDTDRMNLLHKFDDFKDDSIVKEEQAAKLKKLMNSYKEA